ncbi:hypothetical protein ACNF40_01690 [Cuniculiplasma sp. SKW4]|uniref:hypothetical protein n=1 Tax=Cuniculiplasma sp. SKW4 TaxID=3400171 RepID=UPI003FD5AB58
MSDESKSMTSAFELLKKRPEIIFPFIFGLIIAGVIYTIAAAIISYLALGSLSPSNTNLFELYILVIHGIEGLFLYYFIVLAIFWQSFSAMDLVDSGDFSIRNSLSDSLASYGSVLGIALFISIVSTLLSYIPVVGGIVDSLFTIVSLFSIIISIFNKKGFIQNIIEMPNTLTEYYKKEPTTGLFLFVLILVFIVPNSFLEIIDLFVSIIYGGLVIKLISGN